ncbi:putative DNA-binding transcriptional regulator YafY [Flavobacterium sp. HSC-32F16]|uniref:helix-turn-helix transcriptional regulator n=1 Tax=Flavobacterium sp. HSC-32F16 TaxID=2910964 RepID=UPI0020A542C3|nr:WYL domain-containing protein [Flavobacterium sp. HSC-32F16]MCP2027429.1 putative DNA-binding transcriptional regulator YafY [Flavobacterium sp. HSC-32F16]
MAISKHPLGRYAIIDREMRSQDYVKTKDLKRIIERDLSINVSLRMINDDIIAMKEDNVLNYNAPIEYCNSRKAYYYSDQNYTIRAFGLREEDISVLMFYAKTISQYKDYHIFKDFTNAIDKVLDAVNIRKGISEKNDDRVIVLTDNNQASSGNEWIPLIVEAIDNCFAVEVNYQKFGAAKPKSTKLHPYLLKEDRHRWYLIGMNDKGIVTYGLDRILDIDKLDEKFTPNNLDFEEYFRYSFGITVLNEDPIEVILSFTPTQGNYLKTLSLHPTQKILFDNAEEFQISVKVKPSWEFYEKILGYGDSVKILSPPCIVSEFTKKLQLVLNRYK